MSVVTLPVECGVRRVGEHGVQVDKARSWFSRAVLLDPDSGDFWALYYKFEAVRPRSTYFPSQFSFA